MDPSSIQCKVLPCYQCQDDTEYNCRHCTIDLCGMCKEKHVTELSTKNHALIIYREKNEYTLTKKLCITHPESVHESYYEYGEHNDTDLAKEKRLYEKKRRQYQTNINFIRSDVLFYRRVLLVHIKRDVEICRERISNCRSKMLKKVNNVRCRVDGVVDSTSCKYKATLIQNIQNQRVKMIRHIANVQIYENRFEQSANIPVPSFLLLMKVLLPKVQKIPIFAQDSQLCLNDSINKEVVVDLLSSIQMSETKKRHVSVEHTLKIIRPPVLERSLVDASVNRCLHISCSDQDKVWICDNKKLILIDIKGVVYHYLNDIWNHVYITGLHSVNKEGELLYIDRESNIIKFSEDRKNRSIFIHRERSKWRPECVICSHSSNDVLVGMWKFDTDTGKVMRFDGTGKIKHMIEKDKNNEQLYKRPMYITDSSNGDIVVSDWNRSLVVTDSVGQYRFSYTGHPTGSGLSPNGTCTDVFSNILVCDKRTNTVQMIDKDGTFMYFLLTESDGIFEPWGLCYDINSHLLWVGSNSNNVIKVFRYINRQNILTDKVS